MTGWLVVGATGMLCGSVGLLLGCVLVGSAGHKDCRKVAGVLRRTIIAQQEYIDYLEGGGDVVAEAENLLREPGS